MTETTKTKWEYYPHIWKTEAAYLTWLRGQIRQIWNTCPQKLEFLKKNVKRLPKVDSNGDTLKFKNGSVRQYKAYVCDACAKTCYDSERIGRQKTFAVDHKKGNHSLVTFEQAPQFLDSILRVKEEDLQILCKECHDIKTYAEKYSVSLETAKITKYAIQLIENKKDKQFFIDRKLTVPTNSDKRRVAIIKILISEKLDGASE